MTPVVRLTAVTGVIGAALVDAGVLVYAALQQTPVSAGDLGAAGLTGAATSVAVLWAWKGTVDERLREIEDKKADKDALDAHGELLKEVRDDVRWLVRQKRGEQA